MAIWNYFRKQISTIIFVYKLCVQYLGTMEHVFCLFRSHRPCGAKIPIWNRFLTSTQKLSNDAWIRYVWPHTCTRISHINLKVRTIAYSIKNSSTWNYCSKALAWMATHWGVVRCLLCRVINSTTWMSCSIAFMCNDPTMITVFHSHIRSQSSLSKAFLLLL